MGKAAKLGLLLGVGAIAGYIGSLLVSDPTRKRHKALLTAMRDPKERDRVKQVFLTYTQESVDTYRQTKSTLAKNLSLVAAALKDIDKTEYEKALTKTLAAVRKERKIPEATLKRLRALLLADFKKIQTRIGANNDD